MLRTLLCRNRYRFALYIIFSSSLFFFSLSLLINVLDDDDARIKTGDLFQLMNAVSTHQGERQDRIVVVFSKSSSS